MTNLRSEIHVVIWLATHAEKIEPTTSFLSLCTSLLNHRCRPSLSQCLTLRRSHQAGNLPLAAGEQNEARSSATGTDFGDAHSHRHPHCAATGSSPSRESCSPGTSHCHKHSSSLHATFRIINRIKENGSQGDWTCNCKLMFILFRNYLRKIEWYIKKWQ